MKHRFGHLDTLRTLDVSDHEACRRLIEDVEQSHIPLPEKRLCCSSCGQIITYDQERTSVVGSHTHRFTNPHGIQFHIGCFRSVSGCLESGKATEEFTWFRGYTWRILHCSSCRQHMGWSYRSDSDLFFGLILNRLVFPH